MAARGVDRTADLLAEQRRGGRRERRRRTPSPEQLGTTNMQKKATHLFRYFDMILI